MSVRFRAVNLSHCDNDDENPDELLEAQSVSKPSCVNLTIIAMMLPCLQQQSVHIGVPTIPPLLLSLNGFAIHIKQHPTHPFPPCFPNVLTCAESIPTASRVFIKSRRLWNEL